MLFSSLQKQLFLLLNAEEELEAIFQLLISYDRTPNSTDSIEKAQTTAELGRRLSWIVLDAPSQYTAHRSFWQIAC